MSDIVRRKENITQDFEKNTLNGFIGVFLHFIVLGFINLLLMGLMGAGGAIGGLAFLITISLPMGALSFDSARVPVADDAVVMSIVPPLLTIMLP